MRDTDLYGRILGIESSWEVTGVEVRLEAGEVEVFVARGRGESYRCPECGGSASRHDSRRRRWRHLPTCQYRTILTAELPRVRCSEHRVLTIGVPWSDAGSRFTALFEALVIDWLGEASMSTVARRLGLSWDQVDGVMQRAVKRGLTQGLVLVGDPQPAGADEARCANDPKAIPPFLEAESALGQRTILDVPCSRHETIPRRSRCPAP